jgi:adenylate kinase
MTQNIATMYIIMLGAPGSGKGTQAARLSKAMHIPHISSGDLLRNNPDLPLAMKKLIDSGALLSDEMMASVVKDRLSKPDAAKGWILDGYPRTLAQANFLQSIAPKTPIVIYLKTSDSEIKKRLGLRRTCENCGAIYHLEAHPPKADNRCDHCQGNLYQRPDDQESVIENRLKVYYEKTSPLIHHYKSRNELVEVDATGGKSVDEVLELIKKKLSFACTNS